MLAGEHIVEGTGTKNRECFQWIRNWKLVRQLGDCHAQREQFRKQNMAEMLNYSLVPVLNANVHRDLLREHKNVVAEVSYKIYPVLLEIT